MAELFLTHLGVPTEKIEILEIELWVRSLPELFKTDISSCNAITSISECLSYLFDPDNDRQTLV